MSIVQPSSLFKICTTSLRSTQTILKERGREGEGRRGIEGKLEVGFRLTEAMRRWQRTETLDDLINYCNTQREQEAQLLLGDRATRKHAKDR